MEKKLTQKESSNRNHLKDYKPEVYRKVQNFDKKIRNGESIAIIQLQYNYQCNFKCEHCAIKRFQGKSDKRCLTVDDVRIISDQAHDLGLARFVITGGEPLTFTDMDELVSAIDPKKFYINCDTNGWLLDDEKAQHLKAIGVDRIQLSIDSLDENEHDAFRKSPGSYQRTIKAIDAARNVGLAIFIQTVVTRDRLYSSEFTEFIEYFNNMDIGVFVSYAKPVGAWEGHLDNLVTKDDFKYMDELEKKHNVFTHLTSGYGLDLGCIAVKGMFSITQYGDVLPCPYIHISIGNVLEEPLKDIIERGLNIKHFGEYVDTCLIAEDREFIDEYIVKKVYDQPLPVKSEDVFTEDDVTKTLFNKNL